MADPTPRISFKFDNLPKLEARGQNFVSWKNAWRIAFRFLGIDSVITNPTPADTETKRTEAHTVLMQAVDAELIDFVTSFDTPSGAWNALHERYDRDTGLSSVHLLKQIVSLQMGKNDSLRDHMDNFHKSWTRMSQRCNNSKAEVAKSLKTTFDSEIVKGCFFLTTLPEEMNNIIDNLSTKDITKYSAIETKMLDLVESQNDNPDNAAYWTQTTRKPSNLNQSRNTPSVSGNASRECTYCRKHGYTFVGHLYTDCIILQREKDSRKGNDSRKNRKPPTNQSSPTKRRHGKANAVEEDDNSDTENNVVFAVHSPEPVNSYEKSYRTETSVESDDDLLEINAAFHVLEPTFADLNGKLFTDLNTEEVYAIDGRSPKSSPTNWILDTGCTTHLSSFEEDFLNIRPRAGYVTVAGGFQYKVQGIGTVVLLLMLPSGKTIQGTLHDVLYIPDMKKSRLFSWSQARKTSGLTLRGSDDNVEILNAAGKTILWARITLHGVVIQLTETPTSTAYAVSYHQFHAAMGHATVNPSVFRDPASVPSKPDTFHCDACAKGKSTHAKPSSLSGPRSKPLEYIHSDLSGKQAASLGGSQYYMTLIDDSTRYTWVKFLKNKSDAAETFKQFIAFVKRQFSINIKKVRTDWGGEYHNKELQNHFADHGIEWSPSPAYNHETNGLAERMNRTIKSMCIPMTQSVRLPQSLWPEAVNTAVYIKNRLSHSALKQNTSPYEALLRDKPMVSHITHPFGQKCYVHIPKEVREPGKAFAYRARDAFFVGYTTSKKMFRVYLPDKRIVREIRDVTFAPWEPTIGIGVTIPGLNPNSRNSTPDSMDLFPNSSIRDSIIPSVPSTAPSTNTRTSTPSNSDTSTSTNTIPAEPRRSSRVTKPPSHLQDSIVETPRKTSRGENTSANYAEESDEVPLDDFHAYAISGPVLQNSLTIPETYAQAMKSPQLPSWQAAMRSELESLELNKTWSVVPMTNNMNVIGCRWVFAIKYKPDGSIAKYKARLVAQGFTQVPGRDFHETYSPVARYDSLRILLRVASLFRLDIEQMDIDTAYLHGDLHETIHMRLPPGFTVPGKVAKLHKCLYGLKQSGREWYSKMRDSLLRKNFHISDFDPCIFVHDTEQFYVFLYVDDILLFGRSSSLMNQTKKLIGDDFACKYLGRATYVIGIEIRYYDHGIAISQKDIRKTFTRTF